LASTLTRFVTKAQSRSGNAALGSMQVFRLDQRPEIPNAIALVACPTKEFCIHGVFFSALVWTPKA